MKITLSLILAFLFCTSSLFAQNNYSIKGSSIDTDQMIKLYNTTISVLSAKDSILRKFTRATETGTFSLSGLPAGKYLVLVTYPEYADYVEPFTLDPAHPTHDFGKINMRLKEKILKEVLIKGEVKAIKINGDTTEFNAKAYVIQPNDKVEDLLKQLPGIQVDSKGNITANGEAVTKVLLDGEEFFGDDPTLVTKNIRADMVDKFQLYDKKSDQAAFTGIDDGVRTKTINVVLKEDKKKGIFGKASAGVGNDGYYEGQLIYNKFTARSKYALYGTDANDGTTGLGFADQNKIGAASTNVVSIDGGIGIISFGDDFQSSYNGNGLPLARTAGAHYDTKWNNTNESLNTNFKIGSLETTGDYFSIQQQTLPATTLNLNGQPISPDQQIHNVNQSRTFDNYSFKQKLDVTYQAKLDTSATLKVSADGSTRNTHNKDHSLTTTTDGTGALLNQSQLSNDKSSDEKIFDFTGLYSRKLKKGRTFSWALSETYDESTGSNYQLSNTNYFKNGVVDSSVVINQYKPTTTVSSVLNSNMTFTTPLSKKLALTFNYGFALNNSSADKLSYNQDASGAYTVLDPVYSSDYKFNQLTNQLGAVFNYRTTKITLNLGGKASDVDFKQIDEFTGNVYKRSFINWLPQGDLQYRIAQSKNLSIRYFGSTTQPSLDQLQPIATNANPLNTAIGNPNLKPAFNNRFNFSYNASQIVNQQSFFLSGSYAFVTDQIVNNTTTNAAGQSTTQSVNLSNQTPFNYSLNTQFSRKIVPIDARLGISLGTNGGVSYSYVNGDLNKATTTSYRTSLNFNKSAVKKYNFSLQGGPGYSFTKFSLTPNSNNNAATFSAFAFGQLFLPLKFIISSDLSNTFTAKTAQIPEQNITTWNASISKTFLKDDNLKFTLGANNLLNQNSTYNRSVSANAISQSYYTTIQRYFLLSVSYDFTKFGTTATPAK
jgi:hypothetical protein